MTSSSEKRMLTAPNSKLAKVDLGQILRKDAAWETLDYETKQRLYSLLPPTNGETPHDPNVNPLRTQFGKGIENELRKWQDDVKDGRESKKWRDEAIQAGKDRVSGAFDVAQTGGRDERESGENENAM